MRTLTPAERRSLRARAHHLDPVVSIGQHGLTPAVLREIDVSLKAHELVKIRVFGDARDEREAMLGRICAELDAAPVQHLGKLLIVWRPAPEEAPVPRAAQGGKSAAKKAPQVRRPRTPLPRAPTRPPPAGHPPLPATPGSRRRRPGATAAAAPAGAAVESRIRRRRPGASGGAETASARAGSSPRPRKPVAGPRGKSAASRTGASGARRRRKAR